MENCRTNIKLKVINIKQSFSFNLVFIFFTLNKETKGNNASYSYKREITVSVTMQKAELFQCLAVAHVGI